MTGEVSDPRFGGTEETVMSRKLWVIALAVWFIVWGLLAVTNLKFEAQNLLMGVLALVAGVLALLDR